jgi:phosphoribosylanthranilate isomerase
MDKVFCMKKQYKIKVCGMRNRQNITQLLSLKPDYMGFIFYSGSKRFFDQSLEGIRFENTRKTGVFVNENLDYVLNTASKHKLDAIQLHGQEPPDYCYKIQQKGYEIIKAFAIDENFDFTQTSFYIEVTDLFIFDAKGKQPGGNGIRFNWSKLKEYSFSHPFLLSGGIGDEHLEEILEFTHPSMVGVDLNSGFEIEPGLKDISKLNLFIHNLRIQKK